MKRFLCPKHSHHMCRIRKDHKPIQLSTEECSICRWENRPWTLKDLAQELENVCFNMRFAHDDPYYDPFGYTYAYPFQDLVKVWLTMISPEYRKSFLEELNK